jgi:hypothetical protein
MRKCAIAALSLSVALAACREPTGPEIQTIARSVEQKARSGDLDGLREMMKQITQPYSSFFFYNNVFGARTALNEALSILRDGVREQVNGFVVEEIVLTPDGLGEPLVRRSVIAWPNDFAFALHAGSEAHPGSITGGPPGNTENNIPDMYISLLTRGNPVQSWAVQEGTVDIAEAEIDRECARSSERPPMHYSADTTQCRWAMFPVAVRGDFLTEADHRNPIRRATARRHRIEFESQRLPGIQFITRCPEEPSYNAGYWSHACNQPLVFWRKNTQYAPSLGIDVPKMENFDGTFVHFEKWPDRRRRDLTSLGMRWTFHTPNGVLVEAGSRGPIDIYDTRERDYKRAFEVGTPPDVRRVKAIWPARSVDTNASPYEVVVLTVEFFDP